LLTVFLRRLALKQLFSRIQKFIVKRTPEFSGGVIFLIISGMQPNPLSAF